MRARLIKSDGTTEEVTLPDRPGGDQVSAMARAIGCDLFDCISVVKADGPGKTGLDFWADQDAIFTVAKPNKVATCLAADLSYRTAAQWLMGNVLVTGGPDAEGDIQGLTPFQDEALKGLAEFWYLASAAIDAAEPKTA
jgi:hypothetical protein